MVIKWNIVVWALLGAAGCGGGAEGPDEVTATVTDGDEEAWSSPGDPAPQDDQPDDPDDDDDDDGDRDGD